MMENKLKWEMVPDGWALCFNEGCPLREACLRYQAGLLAPQSLTVTRCVTPRAMTDERCVLFASMEPQMVAYGFSTLYDRVLKDDFTTLRKTMTSYLSGKRYYYEYMRGLRPLSPEQQGWIRNLFARYGYQDSVVFDRMEPAFDFRWV